MADEGQSSDGNGDGEPEPNGPETPARVMSGAKLVGLKGRVRFPDQPPGGDRSPLSPRRWRSPIRGPWLTSVFGAVLLVGIPVEFITGLISYAAYDPRLAGNDQTPHKGILGFYLFNWITDPSWIYRLNQGIHVGLGFALVPVVLVKLWSVLPQLFAWPPWRSVAHVLERLSLVLLVGGVVFEFATGILNIDYDYIFKFSFYNGHFFGAWLFITGFVVHATLKAPTMTRSLRARRLRAELATSLADTVPEPYEPGGLVALEPARPTISRRGLLALVGGTSVSITVFTAGGTLGGVFRKVALLSPRGRSYGSGPNDFQINRTAVAARVSMSDAVGWQLELVGTNTVRLTRSELLAMEQVHRDLPIACVEGWSTTQHWSGVSLRRLAELTGMAHPAQARVESLEKGGAFGRVTLAGNQVTAELSMLALRVNGVDLSLDHGYPARTVIPAAPGVHNTKWVERIVFQDHLEADAAEESA
jgi:DMSO/TMAO reductase YedYZ molybdopterin-dependent catalytic subunit